MARKPKVSDASGWEKPFWIDEFNYVTIEVPTGLTVDNPESLKRFSYVNERIALDNWFRLKAPNIKTKYYYGETAYNQVIADARNLEYEIRQAGPNGWA